jgi:hypothetical protein
MEARILGGKMVREYQRLWEWHQALDRLSAVVKLFENKTLRFSSDKHILDRLTLAENVARQAVQSEFGLMSSDALGIKDLDAIKPVIENAPNWLTEDEAKRLKQAYGEARMLVRKKQEPSVQHSTTANWLNTVLLTAAGTAGGNELPSAIHVIIHILQNKPHP